MNAAPPTAITGNAARAPLSTLSIGNVTVTYVPDGTHRVKAPPHYPHSPAELWREHPEVMDENGFLIMSLGSVLVRTPEHTILVDIGFGPNYVDVGELTGGVYEGDNRGGELLDNLAEAGLTPADIDTIVITHLHLDHVGWAIDNADPSRGTFDNATYVLDEREWEHWNTPEALATGFGASPEHLAVIKRSLRLTTTQEEIVPGVSIVPTPGHTPGHVSVLIESEGQRVLVLGDAIHCPVELQHGLMPFVFDQDPAQVEKSRAHIDEILAGPDTYFAGGHFPNRVFGKVVSGDDGPTLQYVD